MLPAIAQRMLNEASAEGDVVTTARGFRNCGLVLDTVHYIQWGPGVGSGVVNIDVAPKEDSPEEEWTTKEVVTFSGTAPKTDAVRVLGAYGAFRHRIDTIVESGTVTSRITGSM